MKTQSGTHQKWIVKPEHKAQMRVLFLKGFEATMKSPREEFDVFELSDGLVVGVFYQDDALDARQARLGAWLEFSVEDPAAAAAGLDALAVERIDYADKEHAYFQAPGGPVFRMGAV